MGQLKAQAGIAKQQFDSYVSEQKKAQKAAAIKSKKTYDDAISYWNDPTNKSALNAKGAYRTEEEIRNDPRKKQEIKDAGFNISDFIDGMYSAESNGEVRSKRESIQKYNKNQNVKIMLLNSFKKHLSQQPRKQIKSLIQSGNLPGLRLLLEGRLKWYRLLLNQ
jgi:hypothetical protein